MNTATLRRASRTMLRPKLSWLGRVSNYWGRPGLFEYGLSAFSFLAGKLGPSERRALREIAEGGDLLMVDDRTYIVAELSPKALDAIAAFEVQGEDLEIDDEDCCNAHEDDLEMPAGNGMGGSSEDDEPDEEGEPDQDLELEQQGFSNPMTGTILPTLTEQLRNR